MLLRGLTRRRRCDFRRFVSRRVELLQDEGPRRLIARARELEGSDPAGARWPRYKASDDATAAICLPS